MEKGNLALRNSETDGVTIHLYEMKVYKLKIHEDRNTVLFTILSKHAACTKPFRQDD